MNAILPSQASIFRELCKRYPHHFKNPLRSRLRNLLFRVCPWYARRWWHKTMLQGRSPDKLGFISIDATPHGTHYADWDVYLNDKPLSLILAADDVAGYYVQYVTDQIGPVVRPPLVTRSVSAPIRFVYKGTLLRYLNHALPS